MGESVHISWTEDKTSAELKRVLPELALMMATRTRALSCYSVFAPQEMQEIRGLQARHAVCFAAFVD